MIMRVIGSGIRGFSQLTLEAVEELKKAKKVYYFGQTDSYFKTLAFKNSESLTKFYKDGDLDTANYQRILDHIKDDGKFYDDIAVLIPGHPRIGVTLVQWLQKISTENQIELRVFEGISSFDTMINDLGRDPLEKGSIVCEANRLVLFNYTIDPTFDVYIYHVCSVGTSKTNYVDASKNNEILELRKYLFQFYDPSTPVVLVQSSPKESEKPTLTHATVGNLNDLLPQINFASTLFIPGRRPTKVNQDFLKMVLAAC